MSFEPAVKDRRSNGWWCQQVSKPRARPQHLRFEIKTKISHSKSRQQQWITNITTPESQAERSH